MNQVSLHHVHSDLQSLLEEVYDPEIPVLSIMDMGVVRSASLDGENAIVEITPTYSGCPAMDMIGDEIKKKLSESGYKTEVKLILHPAWSTDWITEKGRKALEDYGIAAPLSEEHDKAALLGNKKIVKCTLCGSQNTKLVSQFGSTACKALFSCNDCGEPFDYFKCLK